MRKDIPAMVLLLGLIPGFGVDQSMEHEMISKSGETSEVSKQLGKSVKNLQGEDLGTITDVVTGPEGAVAFVVLRYWVSGDTQKRVAVPFGRLSCNEQTCVIDTSKEALESAPVFVFDEELADPKLAEDVYRYFGVQPYWTKERILE